MALPLSLRIRKSDDTTARPKSDRCGGRYRANPWLGRFRGITGQPGIRKRQLGEDVGALNLSSKASTSYEIGNAHAKFSR